MSGIFTDATHASGGQEVRIELKLLLLSSLKGFEDVEYSKMPGPILKLFL